MVGDGGGGGGNQKRNSSSVKSSRTWQQQRTQWLRQIWPFCVCLVFFFNCIMSRAGLSRAGPGWAGPGWGYVKVRGVLMRAGLWGPFPPCAVNINTHFTVNTAAAGPSGPGCPFPSLPSSGLRSPGPALRQTSTCVCMVRGM